MSIFKRIRTALRKRLGGGQGAGNIVMEFRGSAAIEPVAVTELTAGWDTAFASWNNGKMLAEALGQETRNAASCFAVLGSDGAALSYLLTRSGRTLSRWFIDLSDDDVVIYSVVTHPSARGRRLAPRLTATVAARLNTEGKRVLLDCKTWNGSAHRAFAAAGFCPIRAEPFAALR